MLRVARQANNVATQGRPIYEAVGSPLLHAHNVDTSHIDRGLRHYGELGVCRILFAYDAVRALSYM